MNAVVNAGVAPTKAYFMWVPVVVMVAGALGFMAWTGNGNITDGDGARSILWAIALAIVVCGGLLWAGRIFKPQELQEKAFQGIGEMVPMVTVLLFSIALGGSLKALGTGEFIASIAAGNLPSPVS